MLRFRKPGLPRVRLRLCERRAIRSRSTPTRCVSLKVSGWNTAEASPRRPLSTQALSTRAEDRWAPHPYQSLRTTREILVVGGAYHADGSRGRKAKPEDWSGLAC